MNIGEERRQKKAHNVAMQNRREMTVSGVVQVENFNDNTIALITETGRMTIEGQNLHISKLSLETGDMRIDGQISGIFYSDEFDGKKAAGGFISKLFR